MKSNNVCQKFPLFCAKELVVYCIDHSDSGFPYGRQFSLFNSQ
jgi:hypothetical protein